MRSPGHTQRHLLPSNGKGDADRSPGWRDHYDEVDFHRPTATFTFAVDPTLWSDGFRQVGERRFRKTYK